MEEKSVERRFFPKKERLSSRKDIDRLFVEGKSIKSFPLRAVFCSADKADDASQHAAGIAIMVSVAKKRLRHAVDRNRIKRLIRESYRLNKQPLVECCTAEIIALHIAFVYMSNEVLHYADISKAMIKTVNKLVAQLTSDIHETTAD
ncbi:MAG: ribonuclease P protein component [Tannerella sp.]|jgi:ribonuclease P protein component|nr:ribonuclease P protein component [Tannerella sp.]